MVEEHIWHLITHGTHWMLSFLYKPSVQGKQTPLKRILLPVQFPVEMGAITMELLELEEFELDDVSVVTVVILSTSVTD